VLEWEKDFPLSPVDKLGEALDSRDQAKVMRTFKL